MHKIAQLFIWKDFLFRLKERIILRNDSYCTSVNSIKNNILCAGHNYIFNIII